MTAKTTSRANGGAAAHMLGAVNKPVLLALLVLASAFLGYRLFFTEGGAPAGAANAGGASVAGGTLSGSRPRGAAGSSSAAQVDPTLRLDLLNSSRAVNYTGSRRNIFVLGASVSPDTKASGSGKPGDGLAANGAATTPADITPPPPPPPPPVVIPLKFYGVAERSGGATTKALLTSGETILIAQVGQTVAQHFKIVRIGLTKLELEDTRDRSRHDIPLEQAAGAVADAKPE